MPLSKSGSSPREHLRPDLRDASQSGTSTADFVPQQVAAGLKDALANSIQCIQTRPRQRSKDIDALLYKVNFTRHSREPTPCKSEVDEVEVRKVGTFVCEYILRLDVAMDDVMAVGVFQYRQLYNGRQ